MSLTSYTYIKKIGQGSYGEVWLVEDKEHKKCVLKKISLTNSSEKEKGLARTECQLLKLLIHPNIVQYRHSFEENDILYIAMAYCEGGDLYSLLKNRKGKHLSEKQITEWFIQIVMALSYIHERNILHRDLKTQNIFLAKSSVIKVGDLGIAKQLDNKNSMAMTLIGTPYYMSPELFNKMPYNFKSDIWALGCVTYEMATLKHAFNAKNYNSLAYKIIMGQLPSMPSTYSRDLISLMESMLNNKPDKRPSTNRILKEPYIQQHIRNFLDNAKRSKKDSAPRHGIVARPGSGDQRRSVDSGSPFINSPKIHQGKVITEHKISPTHSLNSPSISTKECNNDNAERKHIRNNSDSKNSHSLEVKDSERTSQTILEKEIQKIDINIDIKTPSPATSSPINIHKSSSASELERKENKDENEQNRNRGARNRRREKKRNEGLGTMFFPRSSNDDQLNKEGDMEGDKVPRRRGRGRNANSENEEILVLPQLKKVTSTEDEPNVDQSSREELINLVEKMNETLSFTNKNKFSDVKDSLMCPVNCYDDFVDGPEENGLETLKRTKMVSNRYPEIRKELMHSIGWHKVLEGYKIIGNMDIEHEMPLKELLGEEHYEKYVGKLMWLMVVEEGMHIC